jgi:hypothetical protein
LDALDLKPEPIQIRREQLAHFSVTIGDENRRMTAGQSPSAPPSTRMSPIR